MLRSGRVPVAGAGFIEPCLPSPARELPRGPDWLHEIKHDGYRMMVHRDEAAVRLFTRRGYDWTNRFPAIANAASGVRAKSFLIDGKAVCCDETGVAVFHENARNACNREVLFSTVETAFGGDTRTLRAALL
jgi:bifunctional non-homologous end joining protein LigD